MKFITSQEASIRWGITTRRIQQMCKNGEINGAKKEGKFWMIPEDTECPPNVTDKVVNTQKGKKKKPLPIGISDFKKATSDYYYVDKTLLIRDFIDSKPQVSLFTRPRRFGKTLTMDMLRVFFEKTDEDTSKYFKDKDIWACGDYYTSYQGQYPVVFLTFKDVKCATWEDTYDKISKLIALEFLRHGELETSSKLNDYEKEQYVNLSRGKANEVDYQMSLQVLSLLLYKHYGKECVVIIDEYDTPIQQGHTCGFYEQIIDFMGCFQETMSLLCQGYSVVNTFQKLYIQFLLQLFNLYGYGGLGISKHFRCFGETAQLRDLYKRGDIFYIHDISLLLFFIA